MHDFRHALRLLFRNPGLTLIVAAALGLGIGANTAIFSVVNASLLRPLPYRDASRLVVVWDQLLKLGIRQFPVSDANYLDYKNTSRVFEDLAAFQFSDFNLTGGDLAERVPGLRISSNFFAMLGASPVIGRTIAAEECVAGRDNVVVLGDRLWRRRFGADPGVVGKAVVLDGNVLTVIGVMPAGFAFSSGASGAAELWTPLVLHPDAGRTAGALELIARLKPGVSVEHARTDMNSIAVGVEERHHPYRGPHGEDAGYGVTVVTLHDQLFDGVRRGLLVLLTAVGFVLLIACANVANLLLVRAIERRKEMAIRKALGAGRLRLVRQALVESFTLAALGGCVGLAAAFGGVDLLARLLPDNLVRLASVPIDGRVLGFTLLTSLATGLVFGLGPALHASRTDLNQALKQTGRGMSEGSGAMRLRQALVVAEVALSLVLLVGAGLMIRSFALLMRVNPGFRTERVITARISLSQDHYREGHRIAGFYRDLLERLRRLPGVESASAVSRLPLTGGPGGDPFSIRGRAYDANGRTPQVANQQVIGADYFRAMQIPMLEGRVFAEQEPQPVVIVNETMARGFWPGESVIGRRIVLGAPRPDAVWREIVGVAADVRISGIAVKPLPQMYVPLEQAPADSMALVIRTLREPDALISGLRREVFAVDPSQPLYDVRTMEERVASTIAQPRFQALVLGLFAAMALVLAAIGTYGVIARSVAQRTHEIGIRMALGAEPVQVLALILGEGTVLALCGVVLGLAGALALARMLSSLLYGVTASDPLTYLGASLLMMAVVVGACYVPARWAARVDPLDALRSD
jgi:putative ABC transport system permease protein